MRRRWGPDLGNSRRETSGGAGEVEPDLPGTPTARRLDRAEVEEAQVHRLLQLDAIANEDHHRTVEVSSGSPPAPVRSQYTSHSSRRRACRRTAHHGRRGSRRASCRPLKLTRKPPGPIVIRSTCAPERRNAEATTLVAASRPTSPLVERESPIPTVRRRRSAPRPGRPAPPRWCERGRRHRESPHDLHGAMVSARPTDLSSLPVRRLRREMRDRHGSRIHRARLRSAAPTSRSRRLPWIFLRSPKDGDRLVRA